MLNIDVDLRCTHTAELINSQAKIEKTGVRPLIAENRGQTPFLRPLFSQKPSLQSDHDLQVKNWVFRLIAKQKIGVRPFIPRWKKVEKSGLTPILWSDPDFGKKVV